MEPTQVGAGPLIRDLSDADFEARYACDRFTASVLAARYRYVVQHMCSGLLTTAFSIILRDWYDFAAIMTGPKEKNYSVPAMSNRMVMTANTVNVFRAGL